MATPRTTNAIIEGINKPMMSQALKKNYGETGKPMATDSFKQFRFQ